MKLEAGDLPPLHLDMPSQATERIEVSIWSDTVSAPVASDEANAWFSRLLGQPVRAVYMDAAAHRPVDRDYGRASDEVSFADGFPLLIASAASLADLNARIGESLPMARFRPNLVLTGAEAWAEDSWQRLRIGDIEIDLVKPCARCIMTTQDQMTGARGGPDPMPAMRRLRMSADRRVAGVLFGWNAVPRREGAVHVGDTVSVVAGRPEGWPVRQR